MRDAFDSQDDYDNYIASRPLEARFDYLTIQMVVTEAFPKHDAYGMLFKDYHAERAKMAGYDPSEKKRLSSRFPNYFAHIATDIALVNKVSTYRTLILLIELGMIHFRVDYHDEYKHIMDARNRLYNEIITDSDKKLYRQVEKHTIELTQMKGGACTHFVPHVPEWLYNSITDVKGYLNISVSDFVFFCWCYGCLNCFAENEIPAPILSDIKKVVDDFDFEIRTSSDRLSSISYKH